MAVLARLRQLSVNFVDFHFFSATQVIELLNPCTPNSPNIACSADLPY